MTAPNFDTLSAAANAEDAGMDAKGALYSAAFRLKTWHFVARGEFPQIRPYIAANPTVVDGAPMLKAFTDTDRLHAFAKECGLTNAAGESLILSLPVEGILPMLALCAEQGVWGLHFNADSGSRGFYAPLKQMPIIREHLQSTGQI
jgi:hypothetical protein